MSKLTEIKESFNNHEPWWWGISKDDMKYIFSLLEEKDKALAFYADEKNYKMDITVYPNETGFSSKREKVLQDKGNIARKALNTSSNNEGETI